MQHTENLSQVLLLPLLPEPPESLLDDRTSDSSEPRTGTTLKIIKEKGRSQEAKATDKNKTYFSPHVVQE